MPHSCNRRLQFQEACKGGKRPLPRVHELGWCGMSSIVSVAFLFHASPFAHSGLCVCLPWLFVEVHLRFSTTNRGFLLRSLYRRPPNSGIF
ncbi:hypothetical protein MPTK1_4g12060 [Marchantia polymorpha subsp. ruderalis]|uniref:Uncharacterized protein n=2 Tax=Marchantia polymorpha TaxID=3197 RepID=A0AAF6B913_MARPO|nr:hypothetical protein MARPO_0011s0188 [Marchantia polymorpha]BBN08497.1 hypothetical protein Mp_4g12060 [Marchantia polymorpha subsp. ruderalis]|eukprot:PTQ46531.1 hypothetical protein MARPO_0011s0188 [Marchantia polymorpha]